ncbi:TIR domain-containing protein [Candidatus Saccharibacteria bacterium]|nr:TIR domain-containing protein [Candidatus Saccharibacteria bacterium]
MAYRNKTYVAFDGDTDMRAYGLMKAWKQNDYTDFNFHDAHNIKQARDTSTEETIKRSLRERMNNSKVFVLLVGQSTRYLYRYVRWEIELALSMNLPIIVVNLNQQRSHDNYLCPPILRDALAIHISYSPKIMQFALEAWETWHYEHQRNGRTGPFHYNADIYRSVGL